MSHISKDFIKKYMIFKTKTGELYYPKKVPRLRANYSKFGFSQVMNNILIQIFLFTALSILSFLDYGKLNYSLVLEAIFALILLEIIKRFNLLLVEYYHVHSRYNGSYIQLFKEVFDFSWQTYSVFVLSLAYLLIKIIDGNLLNVFTNIVLILIGLLFSDMLKLNNATIYHRLSLEQGDGLNYGAGMAYSYFYGYLKKILPKTGGKDKNLSEIMKNFADVEGIDFPVKKLFILIPRSKRCPVNLADVCSNIEDISSLEEKTLTVAGVKDRSYKNTVYKINDTENMKSIYLCTEYASPLNTLDLVCSDKKTKEHGDYYNLFEADLILQFYETLKNIIEAHDDIKDLCELIFYDDKKDDGTPVDLAKILLQKIKLSQKRS